MNNTYKSFLLTFFLLIIVSCQETNPLYGEWKLSSYDIGIELDLNGDTIENSNLLNEIDCTNKEILSVMPDGTINSVNTFSPFLKISKTDNAYNLNVKCNEGSLGFASSYQINGNKVIIEPNDQVYLFKEEQLIRVFNNAINIYDSSYTKVIETKDLTLNYTK